MQTKIQLPNFRTNWNSLLQVLRPSEAQELYDLLDKINNEREEMEPFVAAALDDLDTLLSEYGH